MIGLPELSTADTVTGTALPESDVAGAEIVRVATFCGLLIDAQVVGVDRDVAGGGAEGDVGEAVVVEVGDDHVVAAGGVDRDGGGEGAVAVVQLDREPAAGPLDEVHLAVAVEVALLDVQRLGCRWRMTCGDWKVPSPLPYMIEIVLAPKELAMATSRLPSPLKSADRGGKRGGGGRRAAGGLEGAVAVAQVQRDRAGRSLVGREDVGIAIVVEVADAHRRGAAAGGVIDLGAERAQAVVLEDADRVEVVVARRPGPGGRRR